MAKKGIFMSVTATAVIASAFVGAESADAASHKVKSGDNLWTLAKKYETSVTKLKKLNNLSGDMIYVNQVLEVGDKGKANSSSANSSKKSSSNKTSTSKSSGGTYTVKSGDTLSHIAAANGVSVNNLMSWNNLSSTTIYAGEKLSLKKGASSSSSSSNSNSSTSSNSSKNNGASSSSTYTVKSGDTLGAIAAKHGVSVSNLQSWNNISGHMIYPGDKLAVKKGASSSSSNSSNSSSSSSSSNTSSSSASTYTVKSGDTLGAIASKHGVTVKNLMSWNSLGSAIIYPGDKLAIKEGAKGSTSNNSNSNNSNNSSNNSTGTSNTTAQSGDLITKAKSVMGTPYVWGGASPGGFDCSGFISWAYDIDRTSVVGYDSRSYEISNPQVGDLVFFKGTYGGPNHMSHMGIYLGGGDFIHAGSSGGVQISNVSNSYWSQYFDSYKRFY